MKNVFMKSLALTLLTTSFAFGSNVDLKKSSLTWEGTKVTGKHYGKIYLKEAKVKLEKGDVKSGEFVVDMNTFTVDDLKGEWATKFLGHMKSKDFFTVEKFPTASLKLKSIVKNKATADLTIKGKTQEVKFDIKKEDNAYSGLLVFDRTNFGMVYGSGDFFKGLGDKMIHNEVKVNFKFVVKK